MAYTYEPQAENHPAIPAPQMQIQLEAPAVPGSDGSAGCAACPRVPTRRRAFLTPADRHSSRNDVEEIARAAYVRRCESVCAEPEKELSVITLHGAAESRIFIHTSDSTLVLNRPH
jgi:Tfp pilus assembly protein FimV